MTAAQFAAATFFESYSSPCLSELFITEAEGSGMSMSSSTVLAGSWKSLPTELTPFILEVVGSMGHERMTPVQASTIPLFMQHKDVVVEAVTGSGKTLAFVIPILEKLLRRPQRLRKQDIGALVISPTRELASQIHSIFSLFLSAQPGAGNFSDESEHGAPKCAPALLLVSSSDSSPQQDVQRFLDLGADIIVGTPGRIEEFLLGKGRDTVSVKDLEVLVLDEADRLLDLGFQASLTRILTYLPKQRRTGLFSATMTDADALSELVRVGLRNPARIIVKVQSKRTRAVLSSSQETDVKPREIIEERRIPANLQNRYLVCSAAEKLVQLSGIISREMTVHNSAQFIVYFATCACVDYFYRVLPEVLPGGVTLFSLHGHMQPTARTRALSAFSTTPATPSTPSVLLATDVAARGLDLPSVDAVIQFDPPSDPKAFSHRCGRTARAGRSGRAWVLLVGREREYVEFLSVRKIPMQEHVGPLVSSSSAFQPTPEDLLLKIRSCVMKDRALHDKAIKAFVSFARAYSKHEASYIFRVKDLDLVGVATCFGLLRLPRMPELKDANKEQWADADVDWANFRYLDKAQENKRVAEEAQALTLREAKGDERAKKSRKKIDNAAWSNNARRREERELRKDKKSRKRKWLKSREPDSNEPSENVAVSKENEEDDWKELAAEERMAKKVRRGEVSEQAFDEAFGEL